MLARLPADDGLRTYVAHHRAVWECAGAQVVALDHRLRTFAVAFRPEVRRLQTVPGVGPIVALTALAVFGDVGRFPDAKHVASYAGLVPSTDQSGDRDHHGHITKRDLSAMGSLLFMALIGLILATIVNLFWANETLYWLVTYGGVVIFVGLTAYDTQKLREIGARTEGDPAMATRLAVLGSLTLYLDFINLFLFLLRILGKRR